MAKMMGKIDDVEKRIEAEKESYQRKEEQMMITLEQIGQNYGAQTRRTRFRCRGTMWNFEVLSFSAEYLDLDELGFVMRNEKMSLLDIDDKDITVIQNESTD